MNKEIIIKAVVGQVICMWENNVLNGYGNESFEGWCEDGDVFANDKTYGENEEFVNACVEMMHEISGKVDDLTYNHFNNNELY